VALVKLAVYASAGETEVGGLQRFLQTFLPGIEICRALPAGRRQKVGGPRLADPHPGLTGERLVREAVRRIQTFGLGGCDAVLLVDDADCRFGCERADGLPAFVERVTAQLRAAVGRDVPVFVLLASPEIEAWLVADLEAWCTDPAFRGLHGQPDATALRHALKALAPASGWAAYGCPPTADGTACTHKLSEDLASAMQVLPGATRRYRKERDGSLMLGRVRGEVVLRSCPQYAGPVLTRLRAWATPAP
jgi:hypothetical protein